MSISCHLVPALLAFPSGVAVGADEGGPAYWRTEIVLQAPDKLGGCAVGDVDLGTDGREVFATCRDGGLFVASRSSGEWESQQVFRTPGEMIQCGVGNADPFRPGDELVLVGMASGPEGGGGEGAAWVVWQEDEHWFGELVHTSDALLHGVCVVEGGAFVTGFDRELRRLSRGEGGDWRAETVAELPGAGKALVDTDHGVVVACTDGSLVVVEHSGDGWRSRTLDHRPAGRARLASDGERVLACDDDGVLSLVLAGGERVALLDAPSKLRGAALAELDPTSPGLEAATAGYGRRVTILYPERDGWRPLVPFVETERFHHLAAGDLDDDPAFELAVCGYSGRLVVLDCVVP